MTDLVEPIEGPVRDEPLAESGFEAPRLARHTVTLGDGHEVGVMVAGEGVPLVVVHGFSAEGFLYAQSLSRLVRMGFRVIAIDTAGHGATQGLPLSGQSLNDYAELLGRAIDELGIERFVVAGHSMGGQLITRMARERPERTIAVVLIDAIVGDTWDQMVQMFRIAPPLLNVLTALLVSTPQRSCRPSAIPARPPSSSAWSLPPCSATPSRRGASSARCSRSCAVARVATPSTPSPRARSPSSCSTAHGTSRSRTAPRVTPRDGPTAR